MLALARVVIPYISGHVLSNCCRNLFRIFTENFLTVYTKAEKLHKEHNASGEADEIFSYRIMRREFTVRVIGTLLVVLHLPYIC